VELTRRTVTDVQRKSVALAHCQAIEQITSLLVKATSHFVLCECMNAKSDPIPRALNYPRR